MDVVTIRGYFMVKSYSNVSVLSNLSFQHFRDFDDDFDGIANF